MDLRNRTIPERSTVEREPSDDSECPGEQQQQSTNGRSSPTLILEDDGFTVPYDLEVTTKYQGVPQLSPSARDKETPMVRWPIP